MAIAICDITQTVAGAVKIVIAVCAKHDNLVCFVFEIHPAFIVPDDCGNIRKCGKTSRPQQFIYNCRLSSATVSHNWFSCSDN